jgi:hypothetical protein
MAKTKESVKKGGGLRAKLVEVYGGLGVVKKGHRNPHFGYDYVSEGQVMAALGPRLAEHNILFTTSVENMEVHYGDNSKAGVFVEVRTLHTFHDCDSGEELMIRGAGVGWDSGDKGVYKAITGATKYALMKNFMITDEMEPEAGDQKKEDKPGATGHKRTRPYEEETGEGDARVAVDLIDLKTFLTENKIPDGFLLRLLQEKKMIDGHTKNVAQLKPGVLRRCLNDKSKGALIKAWKAHQADEESGSQEPPDLKAPVKRGKGEVRTNEGDQTRVTVRRPQNEDIAPKDLLEQEGYDNWREVPIHFGEKEGTPLGQLPSKSLAWWIDNWEPKPYKGVWEEKTLLLDAALCLASAELGGDE